jgi:LysM repeat protein
MIQARKTLIRSACLITAAAASMVVLSVGVAQERDLRLAAAVGQPAPPPVLNPRHPETYVVQKGDTLWDIAAKFLRDPWNWPEIWQVNPQVENPHLIFPGDTLTLVYNDNGRPAVTVTERGPVAGPVVSGGGVERLSPRVRELPLENAIPAIPYAQVQAFLSRSVVLEKKQLPHLPYVVANRNGLVAAAGEDFYARHATAAKGTVYNVVHLGNKLVDPDDDAVLGYEGIYIGQGRVNREGDPATLRLLDSTREALIGDYLLPEEDALRMNFVPHPPAKDVVGQIIAVMDGVALAGQYEVVVLNRGTKHGLDAGTALRIYQTGKVVRDYGGGKGGGQGGKNGREQGTFGKKVRLPDEPVGTMMVFRTFDRMSYALIMEATGDISVLDTVRNP